MKTRTTLALTCALLLTTLSATSCGTDTSPAHASPAPSHQHTPQPWDPCTVPDTAIRTAGLRTETKSSDYIGGDLPTGWKMCFWESSKVWYRLTIFSTPRSLAGLKGDAGRVKDPQTVDVSGKEGIQYRDQVVRSGCDVAVGYGSRTVITAVLDALGDHKIESCTDALSIARQFEKYYREHQ